MRSFFPDTVVPRAPTLELPLDSDVSVVAAGAMFVVRQLLGR